MQTITINGQNYTLAKLPTSPGVAAIRFGMFDAVAKSVSPFTMQPELQQWPGADGFDATVTLPPMDRATAAPWIAFLARLRGPLNVFQLRDPEAPETPLGNVGGSAPVVDSTSPNAAMTTTLGTSGWRAGIFRVLRAGDRFQIGYRYHLVCDDVNADANGNAQVSVWPSLREQPAAGTPLVLNAPKGLFRLASGYRTANWAPARAITMSFQCEEVR